MKTYGEYDVELQSFLTSTVDGSGWLSLRPESFRPQKRISFIPINCDAGQESDSVLTLWIEDPILALLEIESGFLGCLFRTLLTELPRFI
jgi:hypothetical protein